MHIRRVSIKRLLNFCNLQVDHFGQDAGGQNSASYKKRKQSERIPDRRASQKYNGEGASSNYLKKSYRMKIRPDRDRTIKERIAMKYIEKP